MGNNVSNQDYKDQSKVLTIYGFILLAGGVFFAILAPVEMYCFYLFSEGGRFHYEGFGFGSFMFANIASQIIGYYLIAAILIPLGYGHLKKRPWVRKLTLALLWSWLVVGAPLTVLVSFILLASKDLSIFAALFALVFLGLSYLLFPILLIRFYHGSDVRLTLRGKDARANWIDDLPLPILVLEALYIFFVIMLHIHILFNGMFPLFGAFQYGMQGIILIDLTNACFICIAWGTLQRCLWAWWGSVILFGLLTFSTILTLVRSTYAQMLIALAFPPAEMNALQGIPVQGWHFSILAGIPLLTTWILAVSSKHHFKS